MLKEFLRFEEGKKAESSSLDKLIFASCTGTLVLSANLVLNSTRVFTFKWLLILSWIYLILCLIFQAYNYLESIDYHQKHIDVFAKIKIPDKDFTQKIEIQKIKINKINKGVFQLLVIGIAALLVFCSINFLNL